jgi:hypothetical protein
MTRCSTANSTEVVRPAMRTPFIVSKGPKSLQDSDMTTVPVPTVV